MAIDVVAGVTPGIETVNDVMTVVTGCGMGCRATGVRDTTSDRAWAAAGLLLPVSGGVLKGAAKVGGEVLQGVARNTNDFVESGIAIIRGYDPPPGSRLPHFTIEVQVNGSSISTEQIITSRDFSTTTIDDILYHPSSGQQVVVDLPNATGAQQYQTSMLGEELGPYGASNSCVTHVCNVLREGNASGIPTNARAAGDVKYLKNLGFGDLFAR